jgi:hypothetical protein
VQTGFVRLLVGFVALLVPLSACGGLVDDYQTPSSSSASGESATNPLDDAGAHSLPAGGAHGTDEEEVGLSTRPRALVFDNGLLALPAR